MSLAHLRHTGRDRCCIDAALNDHGDTGDNTTGFNRRNVFLGQAGRRQNRAVGLGKRHVGFEFDDDAFALQVRKCLDA